MTHLIVVPCFNEAQRWNEDYWTHMTNIDNVDWLFVSDGSTDGTNEILKSFVASHSNSKGNIETLVLVKNVGKGEAIRQGWHSKRDAPYESIGFMDADGAFNQRDLIALLEEYENHVDRGDFDAVWSSRVALAGRNITRHTSRHYLGRLVATVLSTGGHSIPYDTQSGLKLFQASNKLQQIIETPFKTRWLFELEITNKFALQYAQPLQVWEMPLLSWVDVSGSKITRRESIRIVKELWIIKRLQGINS
jgi:glycosyltransferase involved in cell wall biosynthesis